MFTYFPESLDISDRRYFLGTIAAIRQGKRTKFFEAYRDLARKYGRKP